MLWGMVMELWGSPRCFRVSYRRAGIWERWITLSRGLGYLQVPADARQEVKQDQVVG